MSRTFRRRDIEYKHPVSSYCNPKVAGRYTVYDYDECGRWVHRPPTKEEAYQTFRRFHLDSGGVRHSFMLPWARKCDEHKYRAKYRQEITRFLQGRVEDVVLSRLGKFAKQWW